MMRACVMAAVGVVAGGMAADAAWAGNKSLIASMHAGDEMRYTYTHRRDETVGVLGQAGVGEHMVTTETVGLTVRVKADTTALDIVEVVFDSMRLSVDGGGGNTAEVDAAGPAPAENASPVAKEMYEKLRPFVGTVLTLNIAPGSGEITSFRGGEHLKGTPGWPLLRRYVDQDLFAATFGPIFQLKSNTWMPDAGTPWYVQAGVSASPMNAKSKVWETRVVDTVMGDVATVKGTMRAKGNPEESAKAPVFFRTIGGDVTYTWDLIAGRLKGSTRSETISTRYVKSNVTLDSDLIATSTLRLVEKRAEGAKGGASRGGVGGDGGGPAPAGGSPTPVGGTGK